MRHNSSKNLKHIQFILLNIDENEQMTIFDQKEKQLERQKKNNY